MHVRDLTRARRLSESNPVTLIAFDLLRLEGQDLCPLPLSERRARLEALGLNTVPERMGPWQVPPTYDDGQMLLSAAEQQGLEGIVSKRLSSPYRPGLRSRDWLKFPIRPTGSFVVGGFRHETGSTNRLGAVLVGQPTSRGLEFRGRVGSGIAGKAGRAARRLLEPQVVDDSPFTDGAPAAGPCGHGVGRDLRWSWTCSTSGSPPTAGCASRPTAGSVPTCLRPTWRRGPDGRKGKRTETPVEVDGHTITLVNLEKVMYPRTGTTKAEVLNYYAQVAPVMLPHLADRAVTRIRWPHGTGDKSFFEKNAPGGHRRGCAR